MIHTLEADSIQLELNGKKILSSIYLKGQTGKIVGLLGSNGQGKSCLMKIIYGTLACEKSIRFDNISQSDAYKRTGLLLYLPQFNFIPKRFSLRRIFSDFALDFSSFIKRFEEFESRYNFSIHKFSGGEQRLIEIYIIVKSKSYFILLDEPFTHLNPLQIEKVKKLLVEEKQNKGMIITDHMFRHVTDICENLYILRNGKTHLVKSFEDVESLGYTSL